MTTSRQRPAVRRRTRRVAALTSMAGLVLGTGLAGGGMANSQPQQESEPYPICNYTPGEDAQPAQSQIDARYEADEELRAALGAPTGDEVVEDGVAYRDYEQGRLYYT